MRNIVSCWDNVSRISDDVKLFPHRRVITVSIPRSCFFLVTQRSWGGVLRDETKTAARETGYETVRCLLSFLFFRVFVPLYLVWLKGSENDPEL